MILISRLVVLSCAIIAVRANSSANAAAAAAAPGPSSARTSLRGGNSDVRGDANRSAVHDDSDGTTLGPNMTASNESTQKHRRLPSGGTHPADACMLDNYRYYQNNNQNLICSAGDIKFKSLAGITVHDSQAKECNCDGLVDTCDGGGPCNTCTGTDSNEVSCVSPEDGATKMADGTVFGACSDSNDYVNVSFAFNFELNANTRYDLGLYIATDGNSVVETGSSCSLSQMVPGTYGGATVTDIDNDGCLDVGKTTKGVGVLSNYEFAPVLMSCADSNEDGSLDFDIGISWDQNANTACTFENPGLDNPLPHPGTPSKCWHTTTSQDPVGRIELPIFVPTLTNAPSEGPSISIAPTGGPSLSSAPSAGPSLSLKPSDEPSMSSAPSEGPSLSDQPSGGPSLSAQPSGGPTLSMSPSGGPSLSSAPSEGPSISTKPSGGPSLSAPPSGSPSVSVAPSGGPTVSAAPSFGPSLSSVPSKGPSLSSAPSGGPSVSSAPSGGPSVSSQPSVSEGPSLSAAPSEGPSLSSAPSGSPSLSVAPSGGPTLGPSLSAAPSGGPSVSRAPSGSPIIAVAPSEGPTVSAAPSGGPSYIPSSQHSEQPSSQPSISLAPSSVPSGVPSESQNPTSTSYPTKSPSLVPTTSLQPSTIPSISARPSSAPSVSPSISVMPTITQNPTMTSSPTDVPSLVPSISSKPSASPSADPSAQPSAPPTDGWYYPDWINDIQVCTNDGGDPEYMLSVQRENYLYRSKDECCANHFWWRTAQCMANEHPMWYKNGDMCEQKVNFEDWEANYSPNLGITRVKPTNLFDTVEECCRDKFSYDTDACLNKSPQDMSFTFIIDISELNQPAHCQDADIVGNALETAINVGLPSSGTSFVTGIGCVTLSRNPETDRTECGGCLAGTNFIGDYDGSTVVEDTTGVVSPVTVKVTITSEACQDAECFNELYDETVQDLRQFINPRNSTFGNLTLEINNWANKRVPKVGQLFTASVVEDSYRQVDVQNPYVITSSSSTGLEVIFTGNLEVDGVVWTQIAFASDVLTVASYFEDGIQASLTDKGYYNEGASMVLTKVCGVPVDTLVDPFQCSEEPAIMEFSFTMYLVHDADPTAVTDLMSEVFNETSLLQSIEETAINDAVSDSLPGLIIALAAMAVTSFSIADVKVNSLAPYFPEWVDKKTCTNNGMQPAFQRLASNSDDFLFDTFEECCKRWFFFDPSCGVSSGTSSSKFYPEDDRFECGQKPEADFEAGHEKFNTLDVCCETKFPNDKEDCCSVEGLGGCSTSGTLQYVPNWQSATCDSKDSSFVLEHEKIRARDSMRECCKDSYPVDKGALCLLDSNE